jgi:hypothetical protein
MFGQNQPKKQFALDQLKMKVVCKVSDISTLTYLKVYEVVNEGTGGYIIIDDFENKQYYYAGYFMSIEESRDNKLNSILK